MTDEILNELRALRQTMQAAQRDVLTVAEAAQVLRVRREDAKSWLEARDLVHTIDIGGRPRRRVLRTELLRAVARDGNPEPVTRRGTKPPRGRGLKALSKAGKGAA